MRDRLRDYSAIERRKENGNERQYSSHLVISARCSPHASHVLPLWAAEDHWLEGFVRCVPHAVLSHHSITDLWFGHK